ncbi:hypothetical protein HYV82_02530 [Candidatus Woesearchaeota archaeon]|nr:hypothetical protein [Candidatus Woesearchaeota archaeon]
MGRVKVVMAASQNLRSLKGDLESQVKASMPSFSIEIRLQNRAGVVYPFIVVIDPHGRFGLFERTIAELVPTYDGTNGMAIKVTGAYVGLSYYNLESTATSAGYRVEPAT